MPKRKPPGGWLRRKRRMKKKYYRFIVDSLLNLRETIVLTNWLNGPCGQLRGRETGDIKVLE